MTAPIDTPPALSSSAPIFVHGGALPFAKDRFRAFHKERINELGESLPGAASTSTACFRNVRSASGNILRAAGAGRQRTSARRSSGGLQRRRALHGHARQYPGGDGLFFRSDPAARLVGQGASHRVA